MQQSSSSGEAYILATAQAQGQGQPAGRRCRRNLGLAVCASGTLPIDADCCAEGGAGPRCAEAAAAAAEAGGNRRFLCCRVLGRCEPCTASGISRHKPPQPARTTTALCHAASRSALPCCCWHGARSRIDSCVCLAEAHEVTRMLCLMCRRTLAAGVARCLWLSGHVFQPFTCPVQSIKSSHLLL